MQTHRKAQTRKGGVRYDHAIPGQREVSVKQKWAHAARRIIYVMEEESAYPAQERPVNRGQHSAEERPFLAAVMWDRGVGVMQERAHDCQALISILMS